jgi:pimeloyl-ACP methyl ester carboxylesterase
MSRYGSLSALARTRPFDTIRLSRPVTLFVLAGFLSLLCGKVAAQSKSVDTGKLTVNGGEIYYEQMGKGDALVFIHGGGMDRRMWEHQFTQYAKRFRAIRYDVRGYGKSSAPSESYSDTGDLHALLKHLGVSKASLVGLSLGGRIAVDFALEQPEMVDSLVLAGPGLSGFQFTGKGQEESLARIREALARRDAKKAAELWLQDPYMTPAMENRAVGQRIREIVMDNADNWLLSSSRFARELDPPAIGRLNEVRAPTLIVVGDRDVADIQSICQTLVRGIRGARKIVIRGAGHIVNMEKQSEFDSHVLPFLGQTGRSR